MFRQSSSSASSAASYAGDAFMHHHAASLSSVVGGGALPAVPTQIPRVGGYLDGGNVNGALFHPFATSAAVSPPSSAYSSSLPSSYYNNIHKSISSHSLPLYLQLADTHGGGSAFFSSSSSSPHQLPLPPLSSSPSSSSGELYEFTSACPVRRACSTGDLQGMNGSSSPRPVPSGVDSCGQDGGGPFSQKVGRYSAEERKERIEKYRVKRHQRNFNKKITYACRKSLADSRPRVKGRFARNGEADADGDERDASDNSSYDIYSGSGSSCHHGAQHRDGTGCNGATAAAAFVVGSGDNGEWWWREPGASEAERERQRQRQPGFDVDEELWATLSDMLSVNLAS